MSERQNGGCLECHRNPGTKQPDKRLRHQQHTTGATLLAPGGMNVILAWRVARSALGPGGKTLGPFRLWGAVSKNELRGGATRRVRKGLPYPNYPPRFVVRVYGGAMPFCEP